MMFGHLATVEVFAVTRQQQTSCQRRGLLGPADACSGAPATSAMLPRRTAGGRLNDAAQANSDPHRSSHCRSNDRAVPDIAFRTSGRSRPSRKGSNSARSSARCERAVAATGAGSANLLADAFEAMPEGGTLSIDASCDHDKVLLSVSDTGQGIAPQDMPKIFEPLYTTKLHGIGLGLSLCRSLLEANQGGSSVQSVVRGRSAFTVVLPTTQMEL